MTSIVTTVKLNWLIDFISFLFSATSMRVATNVLANKPTTDVPTYGQNPDTSPVPVSWSERHYNGAFVNG